MRPRGSNFDALILSGNTFGSHLNYYFPSISEAEGTLLCGGVSPFPFPGVDGEPAPRAVRVLPVPLGKKKKIRFNFDASILSRPFQASRVTEAGGRALGPGVEDCVDPWPNSCAPRELNMIREMMTWWEGLRAIGIFPACMRKRCLENSVHLSANASPWESLCWATKLVAPEYCKKNHHLLSVRPDPPSVLFNLSQMQHPCSEPATPPLYLSSLWHPRRTGPFLHPHQLNFNHHTRSMSDDWYYPTTCSNPRPNGTSEACTSRFLPMC